MSAESRVRHPAAWVPSSYFAEGVPYAILTGTVATMFLNLGGHTDGEITFATGSIGIAWSLKPLWAAFLDRYKTKKFFVLAMELAMAALLGMVALALQLPNYFAVISAVLWVAAFASATQDICVDGVYLTSLDKKAIAFWAGIQGPFWLVGRTFATGAVVALAGVLRDRGILGTTAWMYAFGLAAAVMGALGIYHYFMLPTGSILRQSKEEVDEVPTSMALRLGVGIGSGTVLAAWITYSSGVATIGSIVGVVAAALIIVGWREHVPPFLAFVRKKSIVGMLLFVFLYRTGEGFLIAEGPLFMQAAVEKGGLGVSLGQKALIDGVVSTIMSALAGILGGMFVSRYGLKRSLLLLAFFMNVPHVCYVYLSHSVSPGHPLPLSTIWILVTIEKFGYSFGFIGNMVYMMQQIAPGKYKMTHYAYATSFMQLVLVPTQMASGKLADWMGYRHFFIFVMIASVPSLLAAWRAPFPDPKDEAEENNPSDEAKAAAA